MERQWTDGEMARTVDICLEHAPGPQRTAAGERLSGAINKRTPRNSVTSSAMAAALQAAASAIDGVTDRVPRPSRRLVEMIEQRRASGALTKSW
jgi:hypothetical protein